MKTLEKCDKIRDLYIRLSYIRSDIDFSRIKYERYGSDTIIVIGKLNCDPSFEGFTDIVFDVQSEDIDSLSDSDLEDMIEKSLYEKAEFLDLASSIVKKNIKKEKANENK